MFFQIAAVFILLAFYGCYFGKMLIQKKKGIQTDQIGKGKTGFVKIIELTMKAATISVPIVEAYCVFMKHSMFPVWVRYAGIAIAVLGDIIFVVSVLTMKDSWRAGVSETDKTQLVTDGIYQLSRNPAFLGFDLVYIGILLMFYHRILFLISVFAMLMLHLQIVNVEEEFLIAVFGNEYIEYQKTVNRYFGRKK